MSFPDCAVCLEPLTCELAVMNCGHVLHRACYTTWAASQRGEGCPTCRQPGTARKIIYDASAQLNAEIADQDELLKEVLADSDRAVRALQEQLDARPYAQTHPGSAD
eukprot:5414-Heterococcus_DN1.PRE.1